MTHSLNWYPYLENAISSVYGDRGAAGQGQVSGAVPRPIRVASRSSRLSDKIKMEPPGEQHFHRVFFILEPVVCFLFLFLFLYNDIVERFWVKLWWASLTHSRRGDSGSEWSECWDFWMYKPNTSGFLGELAASLGVHSLTLSTGLDQISLCWCLTQKPWNMSARHPARMG